MNMGLVDGWQSSEFGENGRFEDLDQIWWVSASKLARGWIQMIDLRKAVNLMKFHEI